MSKALRRKFVPFLAVVLIAAPVSVSLAGVPDPQLMTDHPVYRGELSCSTLERTIQDAYRVFSERYGHAPRTETEKLVALWVWQCEHHMHNCDPYVYGGVDHPDGRDSENGWMETRDQALGQFSFGFSLCYTIHAQFSALVGTALGDIKKVRCPNVPGHTPFEARVDGRWALADMTTGMMVFDDSGRPMSIAEIMPKVNVPRVQEDRWTSDPRRTGFGRFCMTPFGDNWDVYRKVLEQQMLFGYSAMPIVYSLRSGETFTRYLDPGLEDGKTWCYWGRDYFDLNGAPIHGPFRNVTFLDDPPVGKSRRGRGNARYSNGVFEYGPALADGRYREGIWPEAPAPNVVFSGGVLRAVEDQAELIFQHASPYVIAARSALGGDRKWEVRKEACVDGAITSGRTLGRIPVAVSVDAGKTWSELGEAWGDFRFDFTDLVKGRHFYLLRFTLGNEGGLARLKMRTVTQVSRAVFPRLKDGGTEVTYRASGQTVIHGGPATDLAERFRETALETPGTRVYRITAPGPVRRVAGVARCEGVGDDRADRDGDRGGGGPYGPWSVEFSVDGGETWIAGMKDVTVSEEESTWGGGRHAYAWAGRDFPRSGSNSVLIRFAKGKILASEVFATYETRNDSTLTVTYGWTEGGEAKEARHVIRAGAKAASWVVPTGRGVATKWVRMEAR